MGGNGDPNDNWKVNGYSWDVSIQAYWSPYYAEYCVADGDKYPVCSLKRNSMFVQDQTAAETGAEIMQNEDFASFSRWIAQGLSVPKALFAKDNGYDPIWYLYHSAESYFQGLWVNCHGYDLIDSEDLVDDGPAFASYCDLTDLNECGSIRLDDPLYFPNLLKGKPWSYIYDNDLTIRKLYDIPKWNIMYDTIGDDFFVKSGLNEFCKGKLSEEWFIKPSNENENVLPSLVSNSVQQMMDTNVMVLAVVISTAIGIVLCAMNWCVSKAGNKEKLKFGSWSSYGAII